MMDEPNLVNSIKKIGSLITVSGLKIPLLHIADLNIQ